MIGLGQGLSLLPAMVRSADRGQRRVYRSLVGEGPTRTLVAVRHPQRFFGSTARAFLEQLRKTAASLPGQDHPRGEGSP